ncbi:hypothetical protein AVEN_261327-1 [Araneus ventricosus]|uniref:Reverse transcriptase domain-containing protein n=1 Tax=Araneus ventricosus TaxID=182803 RepID=A0A4Y2Q9G2_ARAVE|nr:hypothetical protein AVEN_261327-1 [Araneus ventricosus]
MYCPNCSFKRSITKKFTFWYSVETRRLLRRKEIVRRLLLKHRNSVFIDEFRSLRTSVKFGIKRDYGNYLHLIEKDLISEPKKFWSHFKKDKNNNHLPHKLYYNDKCFTNDIDIANASADYFCSVFKPSSEYDSNDAVDFNGFGDFVGIDTITYDDVVVPIKELKSTSTIGIDNIPPFIIKSCAEFLVYPLLALINLPLEKNTFPYAWKLTKIVPVFKKVNAEECKNYQPIAILRPLSKIFEIMMHKKFVPSNPSASRSHLDFKHPKLHSAALPLVITLIFLRGPRLLPVIHSSDINEFRRLPDFSSTHVSPCHQNCPIGDAQIAPHHIVLSDHSLTFFLSSHRERGHMM